MMAIESNGGDAGKTLLIVEDDLPFLKRLARAMERNTGPLPNRSIAIMIRAACSSMSPRRC